MSYDVRLMIDTGKGEVPVTENRNYTYNVYAMLRLAFDEEDGINALEGSLAEDCIKGLQKALAAMQNAPRKYEALNPANGWGSYGGCLRWLETILADCEQHPLATLRIT